MSFSLFKNDKTTVWDEVVLAIIIIVSIVVGILLAVLRPVFWIVGANGSCMLGVLCILFGIMFIPGLIYRLIDNDR